MSDKVETVKVGLAEIFEAQADLNMARREYADARAFAKMVREKLANAEQALSDTIRAAEDGQTKLFPPGDNMEDEEENGADTGTD